MPIRAAIDDFLAHDHVVFVGVARDPKAFPDVVYRHLRGAGRTLPAVNASTGTSEIEGDARRRRLAA